LVVGRNLACEKDYCHEIQSSENRMKVGRIFSGKLWLQMGRFADEDGDKTWPSVRTEKLGGP
jgi:hypothetical protein